MRYHTLLALSALLLAGVASCMTQEPPTQPAEKSRAAIAGLAPSGACCFRDGSCAVSGESDCAAQGGAYQGDAMPCTPDPCAPPPAPPPSSPEGCALGYWKNHAVAWEPSGHAPDDRLGGLFAFPEELGEMAEDTFMDALRYPGGNGADGAARLLLREAVVAVLNATHPDVDYPLSDTEIIDMVDPALESMERETMRDARRALDQHNAQGCPLR